MRSIEISTRLGPMKLYVPRRMLTIQYSTKNANLKTQCEIELKLARYKAALKALNNRNGSDSPTETPDEKQKKTETLNLIELGTSRTNAAEPSHAPKSDTDVKKGRAKATEGTKRQLLLALINENSPFGRITVEQSSKVQKPQPRLPIFIGAIWPNDCKNIQCTDDFT